MYYQLMYYLLIRPVNALNVVHLHLPIYNIQKVVYVVHRNSYTAQQRVTVTHSFSHKKFGRHKAVSGHYLEGRGKTHGDGDITGVRRFLIVSQTRPLQLTSPSALQPTTQ